MRHAAVPTYMLISIHSLHTERDAVDNARQTKDHISIHSLHTERDEKCCMSTR